MLRKNDMGPETGLASDVLIAIYVWVRFRRVSLFPNFLAKVFNQFP